MPSLLVWFGLVWARFPLCGWIWARSARPHQCADATVCWVARCTDAWEQDVSSYSIPWCVCFPASGCLIGVRSFSDQAGCLVAIEMDAWEQFVVSPPPLPPPPCVCSFALLARHVSEVVCWAFGKSNGRGEQCLYTVSSHCPCALSFGRGQRCEIADVALLGMLDGCGGAVGELSPRVVWFGLIWARLSSAVGFGRAQRGQSADVFVPWHVERARGSRGCRP